MGLRLRLFLLAVLLSVPAFAGQDWTPQPIGPFGGINNRDNSFTIPANMAQDALNVNVTNQGKSVKKRPGYAQAFALSQTTSAVHGTYLFYNSSGNDVVLAFNDTKITASVSGGSATVIYSTATNNATFQCSDYLGFAYCADSARDALFKTDGVSVSPITTISSTGTMVAACPTRLAMAGFSGSPARIDLSADTDFTTWGTGSLGTSPVQLTVTAPGSSITHITYAFGRLMWFKQTSFGYVLIGNQPLQTDWVIKTISNTIGTLDNSSTQDFNGNLYFHGQDGHVYVFDGSNVVKLSREIAGTIAASQALVGNSVVLTSSTDFVAGTFTGNTVYADTETSAGTLQTTFPDTFGSLRDGTSGTKNVWSAWSNSDFSSFTGAGSEAISNGELKISYTNGTSSGSPMFGLRTTNKLPSLSFGTTLHVLIDQFSSTTLNFSVPAFSIAMTTFVATSLSDFQSGSATTLNLSFTMTSANSCHVDNTSRVGTSLISVPTTAITFPSDIDIFIATTTWAVSVNSVLLASGTHSGTNVGSQNYAYIAGKTLSSPSGTGAYFFDNFRVAPETFTWTSASQSVSSSIRSWDSFAVTKNSAGGSILFGIRSSGSAAYTSISAGDTPTISTATFWQVISTFSYTDSTQASPVSISDITQNWFQGGASDKAYAAFFDDRVWFSIASGGAQTTNNRILIYDLLYQGWTLYDLPSNGFYIRNNALYFGSSTGGYVYKYGVGNNDAGAAINAYWKSKDFFGADPFTTQEIANISVAANSVANSSMTVTYTLDGSNSTAYTMGLGSGSGFIGKNVNIPAGKLGSEFNLKFGNNAVDQPFEVFGVQVGVRERPWVPN